jgi:hypothetical protein
MNQNVDVYVITPGVGINKSLDAIWITFEIMDAATQEGTGKTHTVLMPTPDAMALLRTLQRVQETFSLEMPTGPVPPPIEISDKRKN